MRQRRITAQRAQKESRQICDMMRCSREQAKRLRTARDHVDGERGVVRPRTMQEYGVENNQSSAEPSGDGNKNQSGFRGVQVEGQAIQASAQGVK